MRRKYVLVRKYVVAATVIAAGLIAAGLLGADTVPSAVAMEPSAPWAAADDDAAAGGFSPHSVLLRSWMRRGAAGQGPLAPGDGDMASGHPGWEAVEPATLADVGADDARGPAEWVWPAEGDVTSEFGRRWGRPHEGLDLANAVGTPIVAATDGEVSLAQAKSGYGLTVKVDHGEGVETVYSHLSALAVAPGDVVAAGDRIGAMGCTGSCTGPHVHLEVRRGGTPMDPRSVLP